MYRYIHNTRNALHARLDMVVHTYMCINLVMEHVCVYMCIHIHACIDRDTKKFTPRNWAPRKAGLVSLESARQRGQAGDSGET